MVMNASAIAIAVSPLQKTGSDHHATGSITTFLLWRNETLQNCAYIRTVDNKNYVQYSWVSLYVRSQTPDDITKKPAEALQKTLATEYARAFVGKTGGELMPYPPDQMQRFHLEEIARFRKIAAIANIKPE